MRRFTLNQRLTLAVVLALLPIAIISIAQGLASRQNAQQLIAERLTSSALATAAVQREPIVTAEKMLQLLSRNPAVRGMGAGCSKLMASTIEDRDQIVNYVVSDAAGRARCSGLPYPDGTSFAGLSWWEEGRRTPGFSISKPTIGVISKRQILTGILPLYDPSGTKFEGMITAGIQMSWIESALSRTMTSPDAITAIADESGAILIAAKPTSLKKIDVRAAFGRATTVLDATGVQWLYSAAPIYDRKLFVVYAEPQKTLTSFARNQLRINVVLPLLAILLTSLVVWVAVQRLVVRWLRELGGLADQFAEGDYSGNPARFAAAPMEIAGLSDDLHSMSDAISQRNAALETAAKVTLAMSREVNHRVKNNLQMVMSLLSLQTAQVDDPAAKLILNQTRARMAALGLIYRLMYNDDDGAEAGRVNLRRLFVELASQLRNDATNGQHIDVECIAPDVTRSVDQAIPLAMLIVEAATNAYRHAFPEARHGKIAITLVMAEAHGNLLVHDNGIGFDPAISPGAMGVELMNAFAFQLDGQLRIESQSGNGVSVALRYPDVEAD